MSRWPLVVMLLVGSSALADESGQPPKPDPRNPVDYVAWVNEEYGGKPKHNAAEKYRQAFAAYVPPSGKPVWEWANPSPEDLAPNERCLTLFAAATRMPHCHFKRVSDSGLLIDALFPYLGEMRRVSRLLALRTRLRLGEGNIDGAVEDVCTMLRASQHVYAQPSLVEYCAAQSHSKGAYWSLREFPAHVSGSIDYAAVLKKLRSEDRTPPAPISQLPIEKVLLFEMLQRPADDAKRGPLCKTAADVEAGTAEVERIYKPYQGLFRGDYASAKQLYETLQEEFQHIRGRVDPKRDGEVVRTVVRIAASITTTSLGRISMLHRQVQAERNATYVVLAMHAFKAKHDRWPQTLVEATPANLAEFRADPFSGKDLVYRIEQGEPLLYSVGENGKDDGGKRGDEWWADSGDTVFWPPKAKHPN